MSLMGELTPLDHALASVVGLSKAEHQRTIVNRLRQRAAEMQTMLVRPLGHRALEMFADELDGELAPVE
jgi:hypothetical protein